MASPTIATRRPRAASSRASRRSRAMRGARDERGEEAPVEDMGGKLGDPTLHGQQPHLQAARALPFATQNAAGITPVHALNFLPSILDRLNDAAKRKVLALQDYFILAWNALRFIFARPFYG